MEQIRNHSIGILNPRNGVWAIASIKFNGPPPSLTFLEINGHMIRLELFKISKSNKPLYKITKVSL